MSTKDSYRKTVVSKDQEKNADVHVIKLSANRTPAPYIKRAASLLLDPKEPVDYIIFSAISSTISIALTTADIIRRRIPGLYQITTITSLDFNDVFEPKYEGLKQVTITNTVAVLEIKLARESALTEKDRKSVGFQQKLADKDIEPFDLQKILEGPKGERNRDHDDGEHRVQKSERSDRGHKDSYDRRGDDRRGDKRYNDRRDDKQNYGRDHGDRRQNNYNDSRRNNEKR